MQILMSGSRQKKSLFEEDWASWRQADRSLVAEKQEAQGAQHQKNRGSSPEKDEEFAPEKGEENQTVTFDRERYSVNQKS